MFQLFRRVAVADVVYLAALAVLMLFYALLVIGTVAHGAELAPPVTQNTVTTTGPVSSDTTISVGTLAGQFLTWIAAAFSVPVGSALTYWLVKLAQRAGVQMTADMSAKLQGIIVNGLNISAAANADRLRGASPFTTKNVIVADAIQYAQAHGSDTIKALGLDPQSGEAVQAIKARIETAITDPTVPTPKVLDPPVVPAAGLSATGRS
jgi:hypothetical protein